MNSELWGRFVDLSSSEDVEIKRKKLVMYFSSYLGGLVLLSFSIRHLSAENLLSSVLLGCAILVLLNAVVSHFHERFDLAIGISGVAIACLMLGLVVSGGHLNTALYWLFAFPMVFFVLFGHRLGLIINLFIFATTVMLINFPPDFMQAEYRPAEISRFIAAYAVTLFLSGVSEYFRFQSHHELALINLDKQKQANTDPLTLLPNRRFVDSVFLERIHNDPSAYFPISVLGIDIDHFKRVNDTHGHDAGDQVLKHIAQVMSQTVRNSDVVARVGGEEFLVLLPGSPLTAAERVGEKIRQAVESEAIAVKGSALSVTVSCGVATALTDLEINAALKRADTLLYQAKEQGRNRVCA